MNFNDITDGILRGLRFAPVVHPPRWQTVDVSKMPHLATHELLNETIKWDLPTEDLSFYRTEIQPNLPWADDHFLKERVGGQPLNPGKEWANWPYAKNADTHRKDQVFSHSYAERLWPKYANTTHGGILVGDEALLPREGIRFPYGDLDDLVTVLAKEPLTRQAFIPLWFPEDLGACLAGERVPCTLGYHFIMRSNRLHVVYYIRSCDFVRHFRDDVYMAIRLLLRILDQCRLANPENDWDQVRPGTFTMHITSLHIFAADHKILFKARNDQTTAG